MHTPNIYLIIMSRKIALLRFMIDSNFDFQHKFNLNNIIKTYIHMNSCSIFYINLIWVIYMSLISKNKIICLQSTIF